MNEQWTESNKQYVIELLFIYMFNQIQLYNAINKTDCVVVVDSNVCLLC